MPSDYDAIKRENQARYGTDIKRVGKMLLEDRYDDRTHFIFELLQNTEDALARRKSRQGSRAVQFLLGKDELRISHFAKPFDERDVRSICNIAESTKGVTEIGRFGIGFKSVFAYTERPQIHSGDEDFGIESYVWPVAVPPIKRQESETVIVLPLRSDDDAARDEISVGLQRLGPRALLFLREIDEIEWKVEKGPSGLYMRGKKRNFDTNVREVTLLGQEKGQDEVEETWLIFSKDVYARSGDKAGYAEIAFSLADRDKKRGRSIQMVENANLIAFFPTVLTTNLGFLVQGPYRTTPSRDNVPVNEPWNKDLVEKTARLLVDALHWLKEAEMLSATSLRCLPLDRAKFSADSRFAPLFDAAKGEFLSKRLLPKFGGGFTSAAKSRLARTQSLRELFNPGQLASLFEEKGSLYWLSEEISADRTPEIRQYLLRELEVSEVTPEMIMPKLTREFLEAQSDNWISRLYEFLNDQPALSSYFKHLPLVRVEDGTHVVAFKDTQPQAFLPGDVRTEFPTVRRSVCRSEGAVKFLRSLNLTEPDPVDDVVWNVLPKYKPDEIEVSDEEYASDIERMLVAFETDSHAQKIKFIETMKGCSIVQVVDAGSGEGYFSSPKDVYLSAQRMRDVFTGVEDIFLVDSTIDCLRGEKVREMLEACGASRYLHPEPSSQTLPRDELEQIRRDAGLEKSSWADPIRDVMIRGLEGLLKLLPTLTIDERRQKAIALWDALGDLEGRNRAAFSVEYTWGYSHDSRRATFDAAFVRLLNSKEWVPDANGTLQRPSTILFDSLGWRANPFLLTKILFKPPAIEQLAKEAGFEPGVLDLLIKHGVTNVAQLKARLGLEDEQPPTPPVEPDPSIEQAVKDLLGEDFDITEPVVDPAAKEPRAKGGEGTGIGKPGEGSKKPPPKPPVSGGKARPFISYVGAHSQDSEPDPDGLGQVERMALEEKAISFIIANEPRLQRTPTNNSGFDLVEPDNSGRPIRWIEVKAMKGSLDDRPVGISRTQFKCASDHGAKFWLYVVEHAAEDAPRVVKIQDPVGKARTFTFDSGWHSIAQATDDAAERED